MHASHFPRISGNSIILFSLNITVDGDIIKAFSIVHSLRQVCTSAFDYGTYDSLSHSRLEDWKSRRSPFVVFFVVEMSSCLGRHLSQASYIHLELLSCLTNLSGKWLMGGQNKNCYFFDLSFCRFMHGGMTSWWTFATKLFVTAHHFFVEYASLQLAHLRTVGTRLLFSSPT